MNRISKVILAASALLVSGGLAAQTFKCRDAAGRITYAGTKCSDLGLTDAGEVKDRLNINPAYRPSAEEMRSSPPPAQETPRGEAPAAAAEPANPERRCFVVHTASGNVTRCNDKPAE